MNNLIKKIRYISFDEANIIIKRTCGVVNFFDSETAKFEFISNYDNGSNLACEDRVSYGDWQTPISLAEKVCETHALRYGDPDVVIEPTCGLGAFVISALRKFPNLSEIHAIEINPQYTTELKLNILSNALSHPQKIYPDIYIYNSDFFTFDLSFIIGKCNLNHWSIAIIGNPPWVTNSSQGKRNSCNLPVKRNNYGLRGIDAITGNSNFDISENITLQLLKSSHLCSGGISFLLKNSVIRNILIKQRKEHFRIGDIEQRMIDASSEFNVSVEASCFSAKLNCPTSITCSVKDFYSEKFSKEYGWADDSFVSDIRLYRKFSKYDGTSDYVWRSGIKHDCASVLELTLSDGVLVNGYGEAVRIEDDMIYPLLKCSDVNRYQGSSIRKFIIVPQQKVGEDTSQLAHTHPLTYSYLTKYEDVFNRRKSIIYKHKDKFSIFGVGDYSFSQYKIVVSSLYKDISFKLVSQYEGKPILVDDTCYQLDFDNLEDARNIFDVLNTNEIQSLLHSLVFKDAKRVVTKNILMRLNLLQLCKDRGMTINSQRSVNSSNKQLSLFD